jgi:23S rRNA (uracil1939-C5)-methyltransferase
MKASRKKHRRFPPRSQRPPVPEGQGERLRLTLTDFGHLGEAMGRVQGKVIFAAYGIPGEEVEVEVREDHGSYAIAEVVEVLTPSPHRVEPRCPHFGVCGGCQLQHVDYAFQLELKRRVLESQIRRIGKLLDVPVSPTVAAPDPWRYRNNARFTVRRQGEIGFTHWHTHRFEPIDECFILEPRINEAKRAFEGGVLANTGARQLSVRVGRDEDSYLIHPAYQGPAEVGWETGQPGHVERLFGVPFQVSAASFFQVHTKQAERMAALVRDRLRLKGTDLVLDAYAGVGTFAALFAPFCARVVAVEESASAVLDAQVNLRPFSNVEMVEAKTEDFLSSLTQRPDAVILDPPRAGCDPRVLEALGRLMPERVVYVSCDPATLARDLQDLVLRGFRLADVTPLDMFPQTYHIESVSTLERAPKGFFILASTSPRRRDLIRCLDLPVQAMAPASGEEPPPGGLETVDASSPSPAEYARALARAKALSLAERSAVPVLGADTVVVAPDGEILGKPKDADEARAMLRRLRAGEHSVITGVALAMPGGEAVYADHAETRGRMRAYTDEEIEAYIAAGDPFDKAGAYGVQHPVFRPVAEMDGCPLNVVGLPLCLADRLLREAGVTQSNGASVAWSCAGDCLGVARSLGIAL